MKPFYRSISCVLIAFMSLTALLFSCSSVDISGSEVTNENVISLTGYVKDNTGKGVPNISATLNSLQFSDTTDGTGLYSIEISEDSLNVLGVTLKDISDTLIITQDENRLGEFSIDNFVDSLPDTYLIQRNISGQLETTAKGFSKVEAIISSSADTTVYTQELWLNEITNEFSSFIYTHSHNDNRIYSVYVTVYDSLNHLIGRSQTIKFPEHAGDINIGSFNPFNSFPVVSIIGTSVEKVEVPVTFSVNVIDSFSTNPPTVSWDFGDGNTGLGSKVPHTYLSEGAKVVTAKVTDEDSNVVVATHEIAITNEDAIVTGLRDSSIYVNDTLTFSISVHDENGVAKILWDFGEGDSARPRYDSTLNSATSIVSHVYPSPEALNYEEQKVFTVTTTTIDSLGDTTMLSAQITVKLGKPIITVNNYPEESLFMGDTAIITFAVESNREIVTYRYKTEDSEFNNCSPGTIGIPIPEKLDDSFLVTIEVEDILGISSSTSVSLCLGFFNKGFLKTKGVITYCRISSETGFDQLSNNEFIVTSGAGIMKVNERGDLIKEQLVGGYINSIDYLPDNRYLISHVPNSAYQRYDDIQLNQELDVLSEVPWNDSIEQRYAVIKEVGYSLKIAENKSTLLLSAFQDITTPLWEKKIVLPTDTTLEVSLNRIHAFSNSLMLFHKIGSDYYLTKISTAGEILFTQNISDMTNERIDFGIFTETNDNNFLIVAGVNTSAPISTAPQGELLLIKVDHNGEKLWESTYRNEIYTCVPHSINEKTNGELIIGGAKKYRSYLFDVPYLFFFNNEGKFLREKYVPELSDLGNSAIVAMIETSDGGYLVNSIASSPTGDSLISRIAKLDSLGNTGVQKITLEIE